MFMTDIKSLSHSKFARLRFWLLPECPSESTILRIEKDSNGFFKLKFVFLDQDCVCARACMEEKEKGYLESAVLDFLVVSQNSSAHETGVLTFLIANLTRWKS